MGPVLVPFLGPNRGPLSVAWRFFFSAPTWPVRAGVGPQVSVQPFVLGGPMGKRSEQRQLHWQRRHSAVGCRGLCLDKGKSNTSRPLRRRRLRRGLG